MYSMMGGQQQGLQPSSSFTGMQGSVSVAMQPNIYSSASMVSRQSSPGGYWDQGSQQPATSLVRDHPDSAPGVATRSHISPPASHLRPPYTFLENQSPRALQSLPTNSTIVAGVQGGRGRVPNLPGPTGVAATRRPGPLNTSQGYPGEATDSSCTSACGLPRKGPVDTEGTAGFSASLARWVPAVAPRSYRGAADGEAAVGLWSGRRFSSTSP